MDLLEQFKRFIKTNRLFSGDEPTLLAVSGGVDSVVMTHLFRAAEFPFGVAHCNFQLRGEESDDDAVFVQKLSASFEVPFFLKHFETTTYAKKNGLSIQMAARELRYDWFQKTAAENGYVRVATAHNLNDSVETTLLNFVRGTGLKGLAGIATANSWLIRPLLFASRADIEAFARENGLVWREDSNNASDDYARNFIRHQVVPRLEELNPNFLQTAARNLRRLRETNENLSFLLQGFFQEKTASGEAFFIEKQKLTQLPSPQQALYELLKNYAFTDEQTRQLAGNLDHVGLELYSNSGWRLLNDREKIQLVPPQELQTPNSKLQTIHEDDLMVSLPGGNRLILTPLNAVSDLPDGREAIVIDAEKLRFPLHLRPWQPGDAFQPFGMNGHSQKLQDFFTNLKLSRLEKENVWVLENGDGAIVWVVAHRLDERFKVTTKTKKFLKINYL